MANPSSVSPQWLEWANSMQAAGYAEPSAAAEPAPAAASARATATPGASNPPPAPPASGRRYVNEVSGEQTEVGADGISYKVDQKRKGLEVVGKTTEKSNMLGSYTNTGASQDNTTTTKDGKAKLGQDGLSGSVGEYSSGRSKVDASTSLKTGMGSYDKKGRTSDGKTRVENASANLGGAGLDMKADKLKSGQTTTGGTTKVEMANGLKLQQGGGSTSNASTAEGVEVKLGKSGKIKADEITMGGQQKAGVTTTIQKGDKSATVIGKSEDTQTHLKGAKAGYDMTDGVNANLDEGNFGGSRTTAAKVEGKMGNNEVKVGGATTDTRTNIKGAKGKLGKTGVEAGVDRLEFSGKTVTGIDDSVKVGNLSGSRKVGSEDSKTKFEDAKGKIGKKGISGEVGSFEGGGTIKVDQNYEGGLGDTAKGKIHIGKDDSKTKITGAKGKLGPDGGSAEFTEFKKGQRIENVEGEANLAGATGKAKAGQIVAKETVVKGAKGGIDKKGAKAELEEASYTTAGVKDAQGELDLGKGNKASVGVGEGKYKSGSVKGAKAGLDKKGARAGIEGAEASYLDAKNVKADANFLGGAVQGGGSADRVSVIKGSVGKTDAKLDKKGAAADLKDAKFEGFGTTNAKAGIGGSQNRLGGGADELSTNKVSVGEVKAKAGLSGVTGGAKDIKYSMVDAKGAKAGLKVGGQDIVGVKGDLKQDMGADAVGGGVDTEKGEAGFSAKNARAGMGLKNTSVNVGGRDVKIPDVGVEARVSTEAKVGVGKAKTGLDLSGTGVNVAGTDVKLGKWAQVGSDVDIRKGNLDLNIAGQKVDVDEGVRKAGKAGLDAGASAAAAVADKAKNAAKAAQATAETAAKEAKEAAKKALELGAKAKAATMEAAKTVGKAGGAAAAAAATKAKEAVKAGQALATQAASAAKETAQAAKAKLAQSTAAAAQAASAAAAAAKAAAAKPLASAAKAVGGAIKSVGSAAKKLLKW